mgnify:CR=1 FL=1
MALKSCGERKTEVIRKLFAASGSEYDQAMAEILSDIPTKYLIRPLVVIDISNGVDLGMVAIKHGITYSAAKWIRDNRDNAER